MLKILFILIPIGNVIIEKSSAVPPDACFAKFRDEDCGMPPKAVMYYYKPGSRCEVAFWRGCLPNLNMFADEYECVRTCIFVDRARDEDYHNKNKDEEVILQDDEDISTTPASTTDSDTGATGNSSNDSAATEGGTDSGGGGGTDGGDDNNNADGTTVLPTT